MRDVDMEGKVVERVIRRGLEVAGVLVVVVVVMSVVGCAPLDPVRLDFGCNLEVDPQHETIKTHSVPLQDAHLQNGRTNTGAVFAGASGRHDSVSNPSCHKDEPAQYAGNAPDSRPDTSLVCANPCGGT